MSIVLLSYDNLLYVLLSMDATSGEGSSSFPERMSTGFCFVVAIFYFLCTVFSSYISSWSFGVTTIDLSLCIDIGSSYLPISLIYRLNALVSKKKIFIEQRTPHRPQKENAAMVDQQTLTNLNQQLQEG